MFEVFAQTPDPQLLQIDASGIPLVSFSELLTFLIRGFFFIAGVAALVYGLRGALAWITSGGAKEDVDAARDKIIAAVTGVFIIIVVLSVIVALEQFVFNRQLCFGLSCPATIPQLRITPLPGREVPTTAPTAAPAASGSTTTAFPTPTQVPNTAVSNSATPTTPTTANNQLPATGGGGR